MRLFEEQDRRFHTFGAFMAGALVGILVSTALIAYDVDPAWALVGWMAVGVLGVFVITAY